MVKVTVGTGPASTETQLAGGSADITVSDTDVDHVAIHHRRPPTMNESLQVRAIVNDQRRQGFLLPFSVDVIETASFDNLMTYGVIDAEYKVDLHSDYMVFIEDLDKPEKFVKLPASDERVLNHIGAVRAARFHQQKDEG